MSSDDPTSDSIADAELDALLDALALKDERRTGWQLRGVSDPETVAAHSWGIAYLCLVLGDRFAAEQPDLHIDRALRLAVVHDLAEAETGDVPTRADSTAETGTASDDGRVTDDERDAIRDLTGALPDRVRDAWDDYEDRESAEAIVVKECDLLDMCLQALAYQRAERYDPVDGEPDAFVEYDDLDEFFATAEPRLRTDVGREIFERIRDRYERAREGC